MRRMNLQLRPERTATRREEKLDMPCARGLALTNLLSRRGRILGLIR